MLRSRMLPRGLNIEALECRRLLAFDPSGGEQELLQLVNRFRTDPQGEFSRLIATTSPLIARDPVLQLDLDYAQVNGSALQAQLAGMQPVPPVAWNEAISSFAAAHNARMIASSPPQQFHSNSLERRNALINAGVNLRIAAGEKITAENVFGFGKSILHTFAAFVIDWERGGPNGMRSDLGHRLAISNADFEQVGQAVSPFAGAGFGPQVTTQVFANIESPGAMVVGAVFEDRNFSRWYEAGEGLGNVQIVFSGAAGTFSTQSLGAGGYQVALPAGTYSATATGGGMRHAVVLNDVTVGTTNVWKNILYDPSLPPPDRLEPNDTFGTATLLDGNKQLLDGLSVHTSSDVDYFRLTSKGTGAAKLTLDFQQAAGNLELRLFNADGAALASSTSTAAGAEIVASLQRDTLYYIQVLGSGGAKNDTYKLSVDPPAPAAPIAERDWSNASSLSPTTTIADLLAKDRDADGDRSKLVVNLSPGTPPAFSLNGSTLNYTAPDGYGGVHRATYTVTDDQGLTSAPGVIEIFVVNFAADRPWHNAAFAVDVNADGLVTPQDALTIINEINLRKARVLPVAGDSIFDMFGFLDAYPDGLLTPQDALTVINHLNASRQGSGEGEQFKSPAPVADLVPHAAATAAAAADHDVALVALYGTPANYEVSTERRRQTSQELTWADQPASF